MLNPPSLFGSAPHPAYLGTFHPGQPVTVLGAGFSGLWMAYRLQQSGYQVQVLEPSSRVGGLIQTQKRPHGPVETAAHSLLVTPAVARCFDDLGVPLVGVHPSSRARFFVKNGTLTRWPLGLKASFRTLFGLGRTFNDSRSDIALSEWCDQTLGPDATRELLAPFTTGVFACHPSELDLDLAFPMLRPQQGQTLWAHFRMRKKQNSAPRGIMMAPRDGMQSLLDALADRMKPVITTGVDVRDLTPHLIAARGEKSNVVLTQPAHVLGGQWSNLTDPNLRADFEPLGLDLSQIKYSGLVTVTVFFKHSAFKQPPRGVGVLIKRGESYRTLGVLFNSSAFPNRVYAEEWVSTTWMFGGTQDPSALTLSDADLHHLITTESQRLLGAKPGTSPVAFHITRWPHAIPVYNAHLKHTLVRARAVLERNPGILWFNNATGKVALRGMIEGLS